MRNLKRVLSLALALVMVLGMMVITTSAADYTDAEEITYTEAVEVMSAIGVINGMGDGTFAPKGTLTREQAAKILAFVTMGAEADDYLTGSTAPFDDVAATKWSAKYVAYCKNLGIINGVGDNKFNPTGTLTVVQFAKMLLVAAGIEGEYTGSNWANNVKNAVAKTEMKNTGIKITNAEITREEACALALAAMKSGSTETKYYEVKLGENVVGTFDNITEAYVMKSVVTDSIVVPQTKSSGALLDEVHDVNYIANDKDAFGVPGVGYEKVVKGKKVIDLFFEEETVAEYIGEVKGGTLWTDLGEPETAVDVQVIVDGNKWVNSNAKVESLIVEDGKANAITDNNGVVYTGNGVVTKVYETAENAYTIVVINTYADTVKEVVKADAEKEIKASTELTVSGLKYETEEFAKGDAVLYTATSAGIQEIWKNENTVKGVITKAAKGVYTIGDAEYKNAFTSTATLTMNGKEGEWYVDAYGNLIANVGAPAAAEKEYTIAVVLDAAAVDYVAAKPGNLAGEGAEEGKEAKEVIKVKTAADEVLTLDTAWKYIYDEDDKITGVTWVNGGTSSTYKKGDLVKYHVNKDGKVDEIIAANTTPAAGEFVKGKANVSGWSGILADDTAIFLTDGEKVEVYTGYANVPSKTFTGAKFFGGSGEADKAFDAILVTVASVSADTKGDDVYVFVAGEDYTAQWDAEEEAIVYVYEDLYVDGIKTALTFKTEQTLTKGEMYAYNTKAANITATNVLTGTAKVTSIQSAYFLAGDIVYTNADTAYVQVDTTKGTIVDAAGLPAIKDYTVTILKVDSKDDVATTVFFSAVEIEK